MVHCVLCALGDRGVTHSTRPEILRRWPGSGMGGWRGPQARTRKIRRVALGRRYRLWSVIAYLAPRFLVGQQKKRESIVCNSRMPPKPTYISQRDVLKSSGRRVIADVYIDCSGVKALNSWVQVWSFWPILIETSADIVERCAWLNRLGGSWFQVLQRSASYFLDQNT
jgi:hypothetical protein